MLKNFLKIIVAVLILLAIGLGIYWFFDRQQGGDGNIVSNSDFNVGDLFPFGNGGVTNESPNTPSQTTPPNDVPQVPTAPARLWQISNEPQSGAVASTTADTTFVRFVDKATGNIFESSLFVTGLKRLTNTTIPKVYEATWLPKADSVVLRYLDERTGVIKSTLGKLTQIGISSATSTDNELLEVQASFLPDNITNLAVNQKTGALAYAVQDITSTKISVISAINPNQIFESAIKDFAVSWAGNNVVALQTKPSSSSFGYLYYTKTTAGPLERVIGAQTGLTTLPSPDGSKVFYSKSVGNTFSSSLLDVETGKVLAISIPSLKEKCVWSKDSTTIYCAMPNSIPSGAYPDHWYQGKVSFNDTFWRISASTGVTEFLIDPNESIEKLIDATNLILDPNENYIIFTNKIDSSLWGLRIQRGS